MATSIERISGSIKPSILTKKAECIVKWKQKATNFVLSWTWQEHKAEFYKATKGDFHGSMNKSSAQI